MVGKAMRALIFCAVTAAGLTCIARQMSNLFLDLQSDHIHGDMVLAKQSACCCSDERDEEVWKLTSAGPSVSGRRRTRPGRGPLFHRHCGA
eukprot:2368481-Pyramimonas_sp.AAC.1